jgi:hypothetical protein
MAVFVALSCGGLPSRQDTHRLIRNREPLQIGDGERLVLFGTFSTNSLQNKALMRCFTRCVMWWDAIRARGLGRASFTLRRLRHFTKCDRAIGSCRFMFTR